MGDIVDRLRKIGSQELVFRNRAWLLESADEIERLRLSYIRELEYATRLATYLWETHWKAAAPDWKPLPDLMGVLTQIDNMIANLKVPKQC